MNPQRAEDRGCGQCWGLEMDYRGVVSHDNFVRIVQVGGR